MERTLVLVKPDGVQRGMVGEVISRLERRGIKLVAMKMMQVDEALAHRHYGEHEGKPFFQGLVDFITSSPLVAMVWEADDAVEIVRGTMGQTNPKNAAPGTIRGDLGCEHRAEPGAWVGQPGVCPARGGVVLQRRGDTALRPEQRSLDYRTLTTWGARDHRFSSP